MIQYGMAGVLLALSLTACGGGGSDSAGEAAAVANAPAEAGGQESPLRLYVFDCGRARFGSVAAFGLAETDTDVREVATPCYIVDHPQGQMLWDAGLPSTLADTQGWVSRDDGFEVNLEQSLGQQLQAMDLGFDLGSLEYVAFSHVHWDHVGAANDVASGKWLIQEGDYAAFQDPGNVAVPAMYPELLTGMAARPVTVLQGDHDVFGDGRVKLIAAYGHTPGHQVLYLDLAETGPVILSGDLYHFRVSRENRVVPLFNVDREQTLASMERVEGLVSKTGATFWIQHELASFESLIKAPGFYQ